LVPEREGRTKFKESGVRRKVMPLVRIEMWEGRSEEQKENLIRNVSDTVARTLDVSLDHITVILYDVPKSHWGIKGVPGSKITPN